jgi:DNA-damage-inducible protein D
MLVLYDPFRDFFLKELLDEAISNQCKYYSTTLMEFLDYDKFELFEEVIRTAKKACVNLNIPIKQHFKTVYICDKDNLYIDYCLSPFACYLITMNADPSYPRVAEAQLNFIYRK